MVIQLDPEAANAWYNRGVAQSDLMKYYEALKDLTEAERLDHPGAKKAIREIRKLGYK